MLHVNVTRVYANTFCKSFVLFFDVLPCSPVLIPRAVAMLSAREASKEELQMKSIVTSGLEVYNRNSFRVPREVVDGESGTTEVPSGA